MIKNVFTLLLFIFHTYTLSAQKSVRYDNRAGLSHWIVSDVLQDDRGFIWMSTWNGLNRFDGYEFCRIKIMPGDGTNIQSEVIRRMMKDDDGNIICRTDNGFYKLDIRSYKLEEVKDTTKYNMPQIGKPAPFLDREGNTWQVERYGITKNSLIHYPAKTVSGTEEVQARAFMKDTKRRWWLATKEDECIRIYNSNNILDGYLGADGQIHKNKKPFGHRAYTLTQTRNGDIWAGCKPGALIRMREKNDGSFEIKEIHDTKLTCNIIYHMAEDKAGRLWLATFGGGIQCIPNPQDDTPTFLSFNIQNNETRCKIRRIHVTHSGNIVGATTNGIIIGRINNRNIKRSVFKSLVRDGNKPESLCNNATMDVMEDKKGRIFIATENNGIDMIAEKDLFGHAPAFTHFNTANSSLTSDACLAMTATSNGHILVVCTDRVMDFAPDSDKTITYSGRFWNKTCYFSEERPLPLPDGSWLFGQEQGAYIATAHNMGTRGFIPPLMFTKLTINGKQPILGVCTKDTIIIETDERNFSLSFAALDYTDNADICYRNKLDNSPWNNTGNNRSVTFYDMQPGEHILTVQSTDRYGRWTDNTRSLLIIVKPHWYETLLARISGWLALIAVITGMVYTTFYIRNLNRQRHELLVKYMSLLDDTKKNIEVKNETKTEKLPRELPESDRKFLEHVMEYIEKNIGNSDANIDDMALFAATSRSNLNRKLRSLIGITAAQLLIDARMQKARQMLTSTNGKPQISEIAYSCGYSDSRYFSRCFKQKYGVTPSEYKQDTVTQYKTDHIL